MQKTAAVSVYLHETTIAAKFDQNWILYEFLKFREYLRIF